MGTPETIVLPEGAAEVLALIERARVAQAAIANYTQEQVDELIRAMVWSCAQPGVAEELAQQTLDETQLGDYNGKFAKISVKTRAALMDILPDKSVGVIEEDLELAPLRRENQRLELRPQVTLHERWKRGQ